MELTPRNKPRRITMSEKKVNDPQDEEALAVDPPNNTDPGEYRSSSSDNAPAPAPVDPPNNT
jgi:hypothetical protein